MTPKGLFYYISPPLSPWSNLSKMIGDFRKDLSNRNGTDSMPVMFEYIKTNSAALVEIEFVINRSIIRKLKQLITLEKFKSCSKNKIQSWYTTIMFMNGISIPLNTDLTKKYDITTLGG